ncbi:hypothetical protein M408DRAFT_246737 [Serendipita vermifera MAFF 305830]|uniref:Uncharacterized protein n=1 Tax=Serendipita vermifera MAFF 305830 TaxID=933852 RepID=A0A0C3AXI8_SERVB|nr:hypothetical protein M408DRAFT_246737 [Serendipita vermifera MAFF 305830]
MYEPCRKLTSLLKSDYVPKRWGRESKQGNKNENKKVESTRTTTGCFICCVVSSPTDNRVARWVWFKERGKLDVWVGEKGAKNRIIGDQGGFWFRWVFTLVRDSVLREIIWRGGITIIPQR